MKCSEKNEFIEGTERVPLLNYDRSPGVPLLSLWGGSSVTFLNFEQSPGSWDPDPLLHRAVFVYKNTETI